MADAYTRIADAIVPSVYAQYSFEEHVQSLEIYQAGILFSDPSISAKLSMHRHRFGGSFSGSDWAVVESAVVTPGQNGIDDIWLVVKRSIGGVTKRYIEVMQPPFEYGELEDAFQVDCGLTYSGAPVNVVSGLGHLDGQPVDVLAGGKVYRGLVVASGQVTLPGGATAAKWQVGLPFQSQADTLELDVGGQDGSIIGRRKKVTKLILSLLETDTTGLQVQSQIRGRWEAVRMPNHRQASESPLAIHPAYCKAIKVFLKRKNLTKNALKHWHLQEC